MQFNRFRLIIRYMTAVNLDHINYKPEVTFVNFLKKKAIDITIATINIASDIQI